MLKNEEAISIYTESMKCITSLNESLRTLKETINENDFNEIRILYAENMGLLIDICEIYVYNDFPDLRPYELESEWS